MILDNIRAYIEKTVLLLSQISKYITYFRRYNILSAPSCPAQQSKEMLKEEADLLQQHDRDLFGEKFSEHLVDSAKSKSRLSKYLLKSARKNKSHFGIPLQRDRGGVLGNSIQNLISTKDMENQGKNIQRKLPSSMRP